MGWMKCSKGTQVGFNPWVDVEKTKPLWQGHSLSTWGQLKMSARYGHENHIEIMFRYCHGNTIHDQWHHFYITTFILLKKSYQNPDDMTFVGFCTNKTCFLISKKKICRPGHFWSNTYFIIMLFCHTCNLYFFF